MFACEGGRRGRGKNFGALEAAKLLIRWFLVDHLTDDDSNFDDGLTTTSQTADECCPMAPCCVVLCVYSKTVFAFLVHNLQCDKEGKTASAVIVTRRSLLVDSSLR